MKDLDIIISSLQAQKPLIDIREDTNKHKVSHLRYVYFKLATELTSLSYEVIGGYVGRDHASVSHGIRNFNEGTLPKEYYDVHRNSYKLIKEPLRLATVKKLKSQPAIEAIKYYESEIKQIREDMLAELDNITNELDANSNKNLKDRVVRKIKLMSESDLIDFEETRLDPFMISRGIKKKLSLSL